MCLAPISLQHPTQSVHLSLFSGVGPLFSSSAYRIIPLPDGLGVVSWPEPQEEPMGRLASPAGVQVPLRIPPWIQVAHPHVGIVFDPWHCPATLLALGLGPEQAVPASLIAPPQVGPWGAPWAPVCTPCVVARKDSS